MSPGFPPSSPSVGRQGGADVQEKAVCEAGEAVTVSVTGGPRPEAPPLLAQCRPSAPCTGHHDGGQCTLHLRF